MKISTLFITLSFAVILSACNTVSGAGKDVKAAGQTVQDVAEETKDELTD